MWGKILLFNPKSKICSSDRCQDYFFNISCLASIAHNLKFWLNSTISFLQNLSPKGSPPRPYLFNSNKHLVVPKDCAPICIILLACLSSKHALNQEWVLNNETEQMLENARHAFYVFQHLCHLCVQWKKNFLPAYHTVSEHWKVMKGKERTNRSPLSFHKSKFV